eukprot:15344668-Ditylum_brightwellii.AAC.1
MFAHDRIQHAAYLLIPESDQGRMHRHIGLLILEHAQDEMLDHVLFLVVDQLNRGQKFITKEKDRMELATLNLKAGEKAMSLAAFISSASYLRAGIDLLCNDHWEMCYDLSLQLHNLYVEAEYCNGHFEEVGHAAGVVIKQA